MPRIEPPLVARTWTGRTRAERADEYLAYLYEEGVRPIEQRPGCVGMQLFRRFDGDECVFTTISYWRDHDAMSAMHPDGTDDIRRVSHLERDPEFLLELPEYSEISELHANDWDA
jgi:quinol monooxygenase YgiN